MLQGVVYGHAHGFSRHYSLYRIQIDPNGEILMKLTVWIQDCPIVPMHLTVNYVCDILFSEGISNVTLYEVNGVSKGTRGRDKTRRAWPSLSSITCS